MPGPTATAGVVGAPCSSATDRTTPTAWRRCGFVSLPNPLKSPLVQGGTLFSSNVVSLGPRLHPADPHLHSVHGQHLHLLAG